MLDFALQGAGGMEAGAIAAGEKIAEQIGASEWLGPLAPVALSPFFGLATLSGIATYGPDWLQQRSALFSEASGLKQSPFVLDVGDPCATDKSSAVFESEQAACVGC